MRVQYTLAGQAEKGPQGKKRWTYTVVFRISGVCTEIVVAVKNGGM